jgi:hypothetical protein
MKNISKTISRTSIMKSIALWFVMICVPYGFLGCASTGVPDVSLINTLPVLEPGQEKPDGNDYVLLLRSGADVPVTVTLSGSLLSNESTTHTTIQLTRDLYLYKQWSSFDGKTWEKKNFNLLIGAGLGLEGGIVTITIDEITK